MASAAGPATPQRPLPGAFMATPGPGQTIFSAPAATLRQNPQQQLAETSDQTSGSTQIVTPVARAARSINETFTQELSFPELEAYVTQGVSGEYDLPTNSAWLPFQKLKMHDLPPKLLEQVMQAGVGLVMGVFPPLHQAWVALDNSFYLWDYTVPNPEILGYEENPHLITSVKLVAPKPGVFIDAIKAVIVVCTAVDMLLLGVATQTTPTGAETVTLYNTHMSIPVKGISVSYIAASNTGRIFFTGENSDDIFEFSYQKDEGWFSGKCHRICHTQSSYAFVSNNVKAVSTFFAPPVTARISQIVIDDTRNLLYTLGTNSEIKVWLIRDRLEHALSRPYTSLLQNSGHFSGRTDLLAGKDVGICAINAITSTEAHKVSLMATTSTGCRLYISATRGYGSSANAQNPPASMQILHIRFPPKDPNAPPSPIQTGQTALAPYHNVANPINDTSRFLTPTDTAYRFAPGYWMAFRPRVDENSKDRVFCAAPDSARLKNPSDTSHLHTRFTEYGQWIDLPGAVQEVRTVTEEFGAAGEPRGFGNELAMQFDKPSSEFAIATTAGVQMIRRRRLVDVFANMMKYGSAGANGLDTDLKRFVGRYGRGETAATALAVACGQGLDATEDRVSSITDPEVVINARKAFIDHGGKADYNANAVVDQSAAPIDSVRPSPRHEGLALYISRLVRSLWNATLIKQTDKPGIGLKFEPTVDVKKLRSIQRDLASLKEFLDSNRSFIEGLNGPKELSKATNHQDEIALQGEHRAMNSLIVLINSIDEGIGFAQVLFEMRVEEILALLSEDNQKRARELTYEVLFASSSGRDLAKELVKAIVNRNIANGSNVDTVADSLRRRCGSFCSTEDVMIFKAQESLKRASEAGAQTETGRGLLNESQRLLSNVAANLSYETLRDATAKYAELQFYAGAFQLCLTVAAEKDTAKRALAWQKDGKPEPDARKEAYDQRRACYDIIICAIANLDVETAREPETIDGRYTVAGKKRREAYAVIDNSDDVVFLTCLYDFFINTLEQPHRLLEIQNPYVIEYLRKGSQASRAHADLLWRYFAHHNDFLQAASVQLDIARSHFEVSLEERISYLSRARTNASTRQTALTDSRQSKQKILHEVADLLDIATVQDELLQRIKDDRRINAEMRPAYIKELNNRVLDIGDLFNRYADSGDYHDICIIIYQVADHRNPADIITSWQALIRQTNDEAPALYGHQRAPWTAVGEKVRELGRRLHTSPPTFPISALYSTLETYRLEYAVKDAIPRTWAVDIFLDLEVAHETLMPVIENVYYSNEAPFLGSKRRSIGGNLVYLLEKWFTASERSGERTLFGSDEDCAAVRECLAELTGGDGLEPQSRREAEDLGARIARVLR